ncbi:MAG: ATP-binding protein [Chloroflexi bacterium]|nr:ATP-binding protein [Chloroflexota bacterium]
MIIATLLNSPPFVDLPFDLFGWLGWFILAAVIIWGLRKNMQFQYSQRFWIYFSVLFILAFVFTLFFEIKLPVESTLPLPNINREYTIPLISLFSAIPWILAAGLLGFWPAVIIGFFTGLCSAIWNTHNIFTPLETAAMALLVSFALRQNYRSKLFSFLRRPMGAILIVIIVSTPIFLITTFFSTNGNLAARLDYAFTQSWVALLVNAIQMVFAAGLLELILITNSKNWIHNKIFIPSPLETSMQERVFYIALPLVFALLLTLAIADWIVAGHAAQDMLQSRLKGSAEIAAENIPALIETGQGLLLDLVASKIPTEDPAIGQEFLKNKLRSFPFFTQFFIFDLTGAPMIGYPATDIQQYFLTPEEEAGVTLALNGVLIQSYVIGPSSGETTAQIAYIAAIPDEYGLAKGVIASRTNLGINLFSQPALLALNEITAAGGEGVILDEENRILYNTNSSLLLTTYQGVVPESSSYFEETSGTGTRRLVYASVSPEKNWKIILSLPASYAQGLALQIAIPLLAISILISLSAYFLLRVMVGSLSRSLVMLANQADGISKGGLDQKVEISGVDEVGRLGSAFEQMRTSLKARLDELDVLLSVSQGIASNFEIGKTSVHLLNACLSYGAESARLILKNGPLFGIDEDLVTFKAGDDASDYIELDKILLEQMKNERIMIIPSKTRIRRLMGSKGNESPAALAAISLNEGDKTFGILWIAYSQPHRFHDEEIRFLNTISGQAILAVSNSSLYMNAEVGKKRLEAVLLSTPEPVLVVGESGNLLIANQAAKEVEGLVSYAELEDSSIGKIISLEFLDFLSKNLLINESRGEINIGNLKTYEISLSTVSVENVIVGKVCVLRDITEFRELEKMKSDFVATVSHDLRAPMGIVRGYATMMQMVGDLNDQQKDYANKITSGLDNIDQMVDKLLDIGRIESGVVLQLERIAPLDLFDDVVKLLQPLVTQRKIQIMRELTIAQDLSVEADKALLQQALYNLLENAIKFSPLGGEVFLRLQVNPDSVVFEIQDHGPGIAPIDIPKIFEKFSRSGNKISNYLKGSGLGLSIVKSICERHKGKVWAKSILGKGSTFFLEIPIQQTNLESQNKSQNKTQ